MASISEAQAISGIEHYFQLRSLVETKVHQEIFSVGRIDHEGSITLIQGILHGYCVILFKGWMMLESPQQALESINGPWLDC